MIGEVFVFGQHVFSISASIFAGKIAWADVSVRNVFALLYAADCLSLCVVLCRVLSLQYRRNRQNRLRHVQESGQ